MVCYKGKYKTFFLGPGFISVCLIEGVQLIGGPFKRGFYCITKQKRQENSTPSIEDQ